MLTRMLSTKTSITDCFSPWGAPTLYAMNSGGSVTSGLLASPQKPQYGGASSSRAGIFGLLSRAPASSSSTFGESAASLFAPSSRAAGSPGGASSSAFGSGAAAVSQLH